MSITAPEPVLRHLRTCRELAELTSQNGWIDNDTLAVDLLDGGAGWLLVSVRFEEVIVEGAGCVAGRVPCSGRVRLTLGPAGEVTGLELP
jgi:hypothetical protein